MYYIEYNSSFLSNPFRQDNLPLPRQNELYTNIPNLEINNSFAIEV